MCVESRFPYLHWAISSKGVGVGRTVTTLCRRSRTFPHGVALSFHCTGQFPQETVWSREKNQALFQIIPNSKTTRPLTQILHPWNPRLLSWVLSGLFLIYKGDIISTSGSQWGIQFDEIAGTQWMRALLWLSTHRPYGKSPDLIGGGNAL